MYLFFIVFVFELFIIVFCGFVWFCV